ncbi:MAG: hypothetical protein LBM71_02495 [Elusimicrobiota bacterium]|jgi:hypothetical protein|nr:hypothetical protein [Elusimicrobiota bacterium]
MDALYKANQEYQLIHGKGKRPTNSDITWGRPEGCQEFQTMDGGFTARWDCDHFTIGVLSDGRITVFLKTSFIGAGGAYEKMQNGSFRCRETYMSSAGPFKKYCEANNILVYN